ncbi:hypothetical protein PsYK624_126560 [Phanerochaete sordida]|uniref:GBD/FH3 domain-containing protein n=1 Tax=Phanerochaete sordida TaxID=48140 RepID=A0A9P3LJ97_9APHY|nr:hypothetical protein PsYK624_126560 [Phanerochaete sordida]
MASADGYTADDFIAYGSDSVENGLAASASANGVSAEPAGVPLPQPKRAARPRPPEQKTAGAPQWYIKKIQDKTASRKQMADLQALLQGGDADWVRQFAELHGMAVLAQRLHQLSRRSSPRSQEDTHAEFEVVRCITFILNHRSATRLALAHHPQDTVTRITSALSIPHLPTRRLVLDILIFLVYWNDGAGCEMVVRGLEALSEDNDEPGGCYAFWFTSLHALLAGRGKMLGSPVGASPDFRRAGAASEAHLTEYLMSNILLMNGIMQAVDDLEVRLHHRSLMESSGLYAILELARSFNIPGIDKQLELFQQTLDDDQQNLDESMSLDNPCDLRNIDEVFSTLRERTQDSKAQDYLLSALQHLLYIRQDDPAFAARFQLIDTLVADLVMDAKLGAGEKRLGLSVERIVAQLDAAQKASRYEDELAATRGAMVQLRVENEDLGDRLACAEALVGVLQAEVARLHAGPSEPSVKSPAKALGANSNSNSATPLKENRPPLARQPSTPTSVPRLNFRGFASWWSGPAAQPDDSPTPAASTRRVSVPGAFGDDSMASNG